MHTDDVREQGFERALRQSMATPAAMPPGDCVDPETLAAWSDGSLATAQAASVELHLSSCPSCQTLLAAFVRAVPAQPAALPFWRRWQLQWLVPLATATAALILSLVIPGRAPATLEPAREDRAVAQLSPPSDQPRPSAAREASAREAGAPVSSTPASALPRPAEAAAAPTVPQVRAAAEDALAKSLQERQKKEADGRLAVVAAVAPSGVAGAARQAEDLDRARAAVEGTRAAAGAAAPTMPAPASPARPPSATPPAAMAAGLPPPAAAAEPALAPPAAPQPANEVRRPVAGAFAQSRALKVLPIDVASPTAGTRWRLSAGGTIAYFGKSAPSGRPTDIPAPAAIVAGASPQDDVCWMVGRSGAVYLTTDGTHFTRLAFPEPVDLVAVRSTDGKTATVTTASGRTYHTTDSGQTWQLQ